MNKKSDRKVILVFQNYISFIFVLTQKHLKLKGEAPVELRYNAYKSVNNGYSLNALNHSHMKCEYKSFLTLTTPN